MPSRRIIQSIQSDDLPNVTIQVDSNLGYLGRITLDVKGLGLAEQFYFSEIQNGALGATFIVHFEYFHKENEHFFDYPPLRMVNIGGYEFLHQTWALPEFELFKLKEVKSFFGKLGIQTEPGWLVNRYVTVIDEAKKHELILFYIEPASKSPIPVEELQPGGNMFADWLEIEESLTNRANNVFHIDR